MTEEAGLLHPEARYSSGCTFVDYNRDGRPDLFVCNYLEFDLARGDGGRLLQHRVRALAEWVRDRPGQRGLRGS